MVSISETPSRPQWFPYCWNCAKHFGQECYRTWREELASAFLITVIAYFISRGTDTKAWVDLQVAFLSSAIGLGIIAFYHLIRAPFLAYSEAVAGDSDIAVPARYGVFGIFVLVLMVTGIVAGGFGFYATAQPKMQFSIGFVAPTEKDAEILDLKQKVRELEQAPPRIVTHPLPAPEPQKQCWLEDHFGMSNSSVPGAMTTTAAIMHCNYRIDAPYTIQIEFDRDFIAGGVVIPGMTFTFGQRKNGLVYTGQIGTPSLPADKLIIVTVYGSTDQYPRSLRGVIKPI
jgi:hypothetical protein